jgi:SAM-dependent methyltransferase
MQADSYRGGSPSLEAPDFWWYTARAALLRAAFDAHLAPYDRPETRALDVGSADGPSTMWLGRRAQVTSVDPDPRGLAGGVGVCARLPALPFGDGTFNVVTAFDVIEHCEDEDAALKEVGRVLRPGGLFLMSVPAYTWAWTDFDVMNGHHRRYTRRRARAAVERAGLRPVRATYAFAAVFPAFAVQRLGSRLLEPRRSDRPAGPVDIVPVARASAPVERALRTLCTLDERMLPGHDLPFGSSVLLAAVRSVGPGAGAFSASESRATM